MNISSRRVTLQGLNSIFANSERLSKGKNTELPSESRSICINIHLPYQRVTLYA